MFGDIMEPTHLLFVLVVALLVLGPKRLPEVGRTLGSGIRDFRQAISGDAFSLRDEPEKVETTKPEMATATATPQQPVAEAEAEADSGTTWHNETVGPLTIDEPDVPPAVDDDSPDPQHAFAHEAAESTGSAEPRTEPTA